MTLKILQWNTLASKPDQIQSEMEAELNTLQSTGKINWQVLSIGYQLMCFIAIE